MASQRVQIFNAWTTPYIILGHIVMLHEDLVGSYWVCLKIGYTANLS